MPLIHWKKKKTQKTFRSVFPNSCKWFLLLLLLIYVSTIQKFASINLLYIWRQDEWPNAAENNSNNQKTISVPEGISCKSIWTTKAELTFLKEGWHKFLPILALYPRKYLRFLSICQRVGRHRLKWLTKLVLWNLMLGSISGPLFSKNKSPSTCKYSLNVNGCPAGCEQGNIHSHAVDDFIVISSPQPSADFRHSSPPLFASLLLSEHLHTCW